MTNFEKLVRWDADYYKDASENDCVICLTEREVYLLGESIKAIRWFGTRWIGDITGLDFDKIAGALEYKLAERMTCQNLGDLLQKLTQLEQKIDAIYNDTVVDNGGTLPTLDTSPYDLMTPESFDDEFSIATDGCDAADKDALYAGISQFVRYVNQANIDALQNIAQAGNPASQVGRLISGIPVVGLLPFDELADYVAFLMNELLDEYEATVDETLLETITCDLFCISVSSNCTFNLSDAINYYGSKMGSTVFDLTADLAGVVQFALTGTFSGDDYFYYMTIFQFIAVAVANSYFATNGMESYLIQVAAGMNSPDNDWTLLCDECPALYRIWTHDFSAGLGDWTQTTGTFTDGRLKGVDVGSAKVVDATMTCQPSWRAIDVKIFYERVDGLGNGGFDTIQAIFRPTAGSDAGSTGIIQAGFQPNGVLTACGGVTSSPFYASGANELMIRARVSDVATSEIYIDKIEILFVINYEKVGALITEDGDLCS
jgi:hypothetical protein